MGGFPGALFALCARPGFSFALPAPGGDLLLEPKTYRGMHGYCPDQAEMDAVFIASGYGVRAAGPVAKMAMVDVGPTIAAFLDAKLPAAAGADRSPRFRSSSAPARAR
jgi:predicted AlkP superfamily pyrophosphatase or phosphodiesterase